MAGSLNKVSLIGNLGRDPDVRTFQNGGRVANITVATSESWRDKASGERRDRTEWHRVSILNEKLVDVAEKYLRKGGKVYVEGQLETRKWQDKDGQERTTTEIVLRPYRGELVLLDRVSGAGGGSGGFDNDGMNDMGNGMGDHADGFGASRTSSAGGGFGGRSSSSPTGGGGAIDLDDDIPF